MTMTESEILQAEGFRDTSTIDTFMLFNCPAGYKFIAQKTKYPQEWDVLIMAPNREDEIKLTVICEQQEIPTEIYKKCKKILSFFKF